MVRLLIVVLELVFRSQKNCTTHSTSHGSTSFHPAACFAMVHLGRAHPSYPHENRDTKNYPLAWLIEALIETKT